MLAFTSAIAQGVLWGVMVLGVYITYRVLNIADLTVDGSFALGGCVCAAITMGMGEAANSAAAGAATLAGASGAASGGGASGAAAALADAAVAAVAAVGGAGVGAGTAQAASGAPGPNTVILVAVLVAVLAGALAGAVTGILHTVFEIPAILAGILTQIALWSVNLRIMGGKSNIGFTRTTKTLFTQFMELTGMSQTAVALALGLVIALLLIAGLYYFFGTELGSAMRATGNNEDMIRALGVNTKYTKFLAFVISNALVALSGALVCHSQKYGDVGMGTGAIVIGLAAIVIGEVLFVWVRSFLWKLVSVIVGSAVYFLIRATVLQLPPPIRMNPNDMKLMSAVIVALALCVPVGLAKWKQWKSYREK
ncbi:MAG: ABC transporter permease [Lachnospiraceae bacterium]|jgi:putative ABC transport system permease protein|nr:ABC transporter permease [Lachnospiraceae bacterium]